MTTQRRLVAIEVDLVDIIQQAWPQVWGSDERDILQQWLGRNTEEKQIVKINLVYQADDGPQVDQVDQVDQVQG